MCCVVVFEVWNYFGCGGGAALARGLALTSNSLLGSKISSIMPISCALSIILGNPVNKPLSARTALHIVGASDFDSISLNSLKYVDCVRDSGHTWHIARFSLIATAVTSASLAASTSESFDRP